MSIAGQEARQTYPAEYQYGLREAYLRGRNAPPADAEIEAKTDGRIDAMSCQLIDTHTGGVK